MRNGGKTEKRDPCANVSHLPSAQGHYGKSDIAGDDEGAHAGSDRLCARVGILREGRGGNGEHARGVREFARRGIVGVVGGLAPRRAGVGDRRDVERGVERVAQHRVIRVGERRVAVVLNGEGVGYLTVLLYDARAERLVYRDVGSLLGADGCRGGALQGRIKSGTDLCERLSRFFIL